MKPWQVCAVVAVLSAVVGCGGSDPVEKAPAPQEFEAPAGVTLTEPGTRLAVGEAATAVYGVDEQARSAVTINVSDIAEGSMDDFESFTLDEQTQKSTPFYVRASVVNEGPAGLGGAAVPLYVHDSADEVAPPNELVGNFEPCPDGLLPESFLPEATADVCLVFLVTEGETLKSVDLRTSGLDEAIVWTP